MKTPLKYKLSKKSPSTNRDNYLGNTIEENFLPKCVTS